MIIGSLPIPTADSEEYWKGTRDGYICVPVCTKCGEYNWFPRAMCRNCSGVELYWHQLSGNATLYSFTIVEQRSGDNVDHRYILALVDLAEGVRMMTHIVDVDFDTVRIGMNLRVRFEKVSDEISLPVFAPA